MIEKNKEEGINKINHVNLHYHRVLSATATEKAKTILL